MRLLGIVVAILAAVLAAVPAAAEPLNCVRVVNDRAPDCSSLAAIVQSVTKDCKTEDERAIAIYNFCRYDHYHHAYPSEPGGISALKLINVYGWSLCGGEHTVMAALWEAAGYPWRYRGWSNPGHTTVEVSYGGRWHYLDTLLKSAPPLAAVIATNCGCPRRAANSPSSPGCSSCAANYWLPDSNPCPSQCRRAFPRLTPSTWPMSPIRG